MLDRASKLLFTVAVAAGLFVLRPVCQGQDAAPAAKTKNWKDRAEYDLYNAITKEQNANKRLDLLNSWKEKYPTSDYAPERLQVYMTTYSALNQPDKVISTGNELLQLDPNNLTALILMASNAQNPAANKPEDLDAGQKAANALITNLDTFFAPDKKPATASDAAWAQAKTQTETLAHTSLGWILLQKKDNAGAEKEFTTVLKLTPNNAQVSYWLGTALAQEAIKDNKPEKQPEALFHFARAASLDPSQGGLPAASRQPIDQYFVNAYNRFHGQDPEGLKQLRELAKSQPFPPAGFTIKDVNQVKAENEKKFEEQNPALALWMHLKEALTAADGEQYFNSNMKGADVPGGANGVQKFKGKLISMKPAVRPKTLVLSLTDGTTPEVTLNLDAALAGKAEPGIELEFSGVPAAYTKDPFNVTFDVEKKNLSGWTGKEAAPVHHRATTKKKG